jgi:seryl-tRNA synthetase
MLFLARDGGEGGDGGDGGKDGSGAGGQGDAGNTAATEAAAATAAAETKALQDELVSARTELKQAQKKLEERDNQDLSERERLVKERDELKSKLDSASSSARDLNVQIAAQKLGVRQDALDVVARLVDWDKVSDPADPKAIERAVRDLLEKHSYLSTVAGGADGGAGGAGSSSRQTDMNQLIRKAAGRA